MWGYPQEIIDFSSNAIHVKCSLFSLCTFVILFGITLWSARYTKINCRKSVAYYTHATQSKIHYTLKSGQHRMVVVKRCYLQKDFVMKS